jgi:hypothetical protein
MADMADTNSSTTRRGAPIYWRILVHGITSGFDLGFICFPQLWAEKCSHIRCDFSGHSAELGGPPLVIGEKTPEKHVG